MLIVVTISDRYGKLTLDLVSRSCLPEPLLALYIRKRSKIPYAKHCAGDFFFENWWAVISNQASGHTLPTSVQFLCQKDTWHGVLDAAAHSNASPSAAESVAGLPRAITPATARWLTWINVNSWRGKLTCSFSHDKKTKMAAEAEGQRQLTKRERAFLGQLPDDFLRVSEPSRSATTVGSGARSVQ